MNVKIGDYYGFSLMNERDKITNKKGINITSCWGQVFKGKGDPYLEFHREKKGSSLNCLYQGVALFCPVLTVPDIKKKLTKNCWTQG